MKCAVLVDVRVHLEDGRLLDEVELVGRHLLQPHLSLAAYAPGVVAGLLLLRPGENVYKFC